MTVKGRSKAGNISILIQMQVNLRLVDDPVLRHDGCQWRRYRGRRGIPPPEIH